MSESEEVPPPPLKGRARRVRKNLRQGLSLAWAASPRSLTRYTVLGMVNATMPPIAVLLGATLVNRIADARVQSLQLTDLLPIVIGLWVTTSVQRTIGAYNSARINLNTIVGGVQSSASGILTAALFAAVGARFAHSWALPAFLVLTAALIAISWISSRSSTSGERVNATSSRPSKKV